MQKQQKKFFILQEPILKLVIFRMYYIKSLASSGALHGLNPKIQG